MNFDWVSDVADFHVKFGHPILSRPRFPDINRRDAKVMLIREEYKELMQAESRGDLIEVADGLVDLTYTAISMALEYGIDMQAVWKEVHAANMRKEGTRASDMRVLKPDGWVPPNIKKALGL